jgi:acyl carrier protein
MPALNPPVSTPSDEPLLANPDGIARDDDNLREALKRCSPATYYAACQFRATGRPEHLSAFLLGVIERYVERDRRQKLATPCDDVRLVEDLGLDSLTMIELVMLAEEVLPISIANENLRQLRTVSDVQRFAIEQLRAHKSGTAVAVADRAVAPVSPTRPPPSAAPACLPQPDQA